MERSDSAGHHQLQGIFSPSLWKTFNSQRPWVCGQTCFLQVWCAITHTPHPSDIKQPSAPTVTSSPLPTDLPPALGICIQDVCELFQKQKIKKAPGQDGMSLSRLKVCVDQLAFVFMHIFNSSLELHKVSSCFKQSTIISLPKKSSVSVLNY